VSDMRSLQRISPDGRVETTLMSDPSSRMLSVQSCGERYIVLSWAFHGGTNRAWIWRANPDGSNPIALTKGTFDFRPVCSPDGKWVYYYAGAPHFMMRVPVEGGVAQPVPGSEVPLMYGGGVGQALSPDGKLLAFDADLTAPNDPQSAISRLAVVELDSKAQSSPRLISPDPRISGGIQSGNYNDDLMFAPDGKSLAYVIRDKGVDNVFVQPLDGTPGHQITNFTSDTITQFQWSADGKTLAIARRHGTSDVVLLQEK
jgi:eukaryotic-like serine/threonine-protein kinase